MRSIKPSLSMSKEVRPYHLLPVKDAELARLGPLAVGDHVELTSRHLESRSHDLIDDDAVHAS